MWLDDVVTHTTIRSVWGNSVHDRIVQTFDTVAERDSKTSVLPDGSLCHVAADGRLYVKTAGAWRPVGPVTVGGTLVLPPDQGAGFTPGAVAMNVATITIPPGYKTGLFTLMANVVPGPNTPATWQCEIQLYLNGGATLIGAAQTTGPGTVSSTVHLSTMWTVNPAGEAGIANITNKSTAGGLFVTNNGIYTRLQAVLCP